MLNIIIIFSIIMIITSIVFSTLRNKDEVILKRRKIQANELFRENVLKKRLESFVEIKVKNSKRKSIEIMCLQAGMKITYMEFMMISFATAIIVALSAGMVMNNPILGVIFFIIGYIMPRQFILLLKNQRLAKMNKQIGSFLYMILSRFESTKDFNKALNMTVIEFKGEEPIYSNIKQTSLEISIGTNVFDALDNLAKATGNKYLRLFSDYYKIASAIGTEEVRKKLLWQSYFQFEENRKALALLKREITSTKSEAYIMLATIPLFAIYQVFTNDNYVNFMTNTSIGKIGTAGIVSVFVGCFWLINAKIGAPIE